MRRFSIACAVLAFASPVFLASPAAAADGIVALRTLPPLRPYVDALPEIAAPADAAERKINAQLRRLDARMRAATSGCKGEWTRTVDAPMRGPRYFSVVVVDALTCDDRGQTSASTMAIVYDLRTGSPVLWRKLLPKALAGTLALAEAADGTKTVTLASKRLFALYLDGYRHDDPDCRKAMTDEGADGPPAMSAWLDAKAGGLALQFDVPAVIQACADPVVIPAETLRKEGVDAGLVDAVEAAHRAWRP